MKNLKHSFWMTLAPALAAATLMACGGGGDDDNRAPVDVYNAKVLVSDGSSPAPNTAADLKNGWGIAFNPTGTAWVSGNGSQRSVLFDGNGVPQSLVVSIPAGSNGAAGPTGIVFNGVATDFVITSAGKTANAVFLFATDAGTIAGWSPKVLPTDAVTAFDDGAGGAIYKGLTLASRGTTNFLFAADFHNNKIDVFDASFKKVASTGTFRDPAIPAGFAPFGIQAIGSRLYVTYAKQDAAARVQVTGAGLGFVDVFDTAGNLLQQLPTGDLFNAPWGVAQAPSNFGTFSNDLLVGNFGDGTISAFDPTSLKFLGKLKLADGSSFTQKGLWGIAFGNDVQSQPKNTLFYAAGPNGKLAGIYGRIDTTTIKP
jgi:uncharacterized protein (TIGR03118 family)